VPQLKEKHYDQVRLLYDLINTNRAVEKPRDLAMDFMLHPSIDFLSHERVMKDEAFALSAEYSDNCGFQFLDTNVDVGPVLMHITSVKLSNRSELAKLSSEQRSNEPYQVELMGNDNTEITYQRIRAVADTPLHVN
jgi:hypothetical protein